jgi:hypothetical protein
MIPAWNWGLIGVLACGAAFWVGVGLLIAWAL